MSAAQPRPAHPATQAEPQEARPRLVRGALVVAGSSNTDCIPVLDSRSKHFSEPREVGAAA